MWANERLQAGEQPASGGTLPGDLARPQAGQAQASRRDLVPEAIAQLPSTAQRVPGNARMPETGTGLSGSRVSQGLGERGQVYDLPGRDAWVIEQ